MYYIIDDLSLPEGYRETIINDEYISSTQPLEGGIYNLSMSDGISIEVTEEIYDKIKNHLMPEDLR